MILNGGVYRGKRLLSEASIHEMTKKQTGPTLPDGYGLGWGVGGGAFGHGGAYSTNFNIDPNRELILIWMVQHAGFPNNGDKSYGAFEGAAHKAFSSN
jgi:CubicO group peptidase (beta-lactamase class C family)